MRDPTFVQPLTDPAARRVIAELRRRLDAASVLADRAAAREAELAHLRRRVDALLAAWRSEVEALRRRTDELEAQAVAGAAREASLRVLEEEVKETASERDALLAAASEMRAELIRLRGLLTDGADGPATDAATSGEVPPDREGAAHEAAASEFEERPAQRVGDGEERVADRLARQQQALAEKDRRIRERAGTGALSTALERIADLEAELAARRAETMPPFDPEDLQRIRGIGPAIERTLRALGITTLRQVAGLGDVDLARIDDALGVFRGRAVRDRWVEQAGGLLNSFERGTVEVDPAHPAPPREA